MLLLQRCFCSSKNHLLKNLCSGTHREGFHFLLILDLWGIRFDAVVVFGLDKNLLFKSVLGHWQGNNFRYQKILHTMR